VVLFVTAQGSTPIRFVCAFSFVHHHMHHAYLYSPNYFIKALFYCQNYSLFTPKTKTIFFWYLCGPKTIFKMVLKQPENKKTENSFKEKKREETPQPARPRKAQSAAHSAAT
jgi:hypothetical protein